MILHLLGCLTWSEGQIERGRLNCERLEACDGLVALGYPDVAACTAAAEAQPYDDADCPGYTSAAMNLCLDAWRDAVAEPDCDTDLTMVCDICV